METETITAELFKMQDEVYAAFQAKIISTVERERIIGVRTPALRSFAKALASNKDQRPLLDSFLATLPHTYFEENQLHAFVISLEKDFELCARLVDAFLPHVDNWATCDQLLPKAFKRESKRLLPLIRRWIKSGKTYTVRFGIGMLMQHFLGKEFKTEYADMVANIRSGEYYVNMMRAWYFATALAKQYESALAYLEQRRLDPWTHNKAIQKGTESYRLTQEQKLHLKTLKV